MKGFGEALTQIMVDWQKVCERGFVFNPHVAVTEADKNAVRVQIATRKRALEITLNAGAAELQAIRQERIIKTNALSSLLQAASLKLAQTQADLNII